MRWLYEVNVDRHAEALDRTIRFEIRLQDIIDDTFSVDDDSVASSDESDVDEPQIPVEGWPYDPEEDHAIRPQELGMGLLCRRIDLCIAKRQ